MNDLISRKAAIGIIQSMYPEMPRIPWIRKDWQEQYEPYIRTENAIRELPSAQPDAIPLEWIDKHLEWLDNCDNGFAQLAKVSIRAMVEIWKKEKT